jgi:hypothetical protein
VELADAKGLHDLRTILGAHGSPVHVLALLDPSARPHATGSDLVLDDRAKAEYRGRLATLARQIDEAEDQRRAAALHAERDFLVAELAAAAGLRGRPRRLGDESERARKTISARVRDTLHKIDEAHPQLGVHLRAAVRMGATCTYTPESPTTWLLA